MKYNPKCMYIIADEYNNLPFYLETNNYIVKSKNIIRYLMNMNEEVLCSKIAKSCEKKVKKYLEN